MQNFEDMASRELQKRYDEMAAKDPSVPAAVIWASLPVSAMAYALEMKVQLTSLQSGQKPQLPN